ncbi:MAG: CBS domain-containing protein [Saprospiraceae bacterium]|jgi:signal-transduction protein with cAMP-binding, CBS, and nucleotidyltransferase domain|nr:CBS domain-containing protein [Saprospiraceae bacterium]
MKALDIIDHTLVPITEDKQVRDILLYSEDHLWKHVVIQSESHEFIGIVFSDDLLEFDEEMHISELPKYLFNQTHIQDEANIFEALQHLSAQSFQCIPVISNGLVLGIISIESLVKKLGSLFGAQDPGAIIVLKMAKIDYSLQQISRIIESEDAKILSLCIEQATEAQSILLMLKLNTFSIDRIIEILIAHHYEVFSFYSEEESLYKARYDALWHYLNV